MDILVGYTGFVGQNLNMQYNFDAVFNSKNIVDAYNISPDLCVYSGVRSEKFRADNFPDEDLTHINEAIENICKINPKQLVLISTVDVIPSVQSEYVYEDTNYDTDKLTPYGKHRLFLENTIRSIYPDALIVRLPALFGLGIKKNFIFDLINFYPPTLQKNKFKELQNKQPLLENFYSEDSNGFYRILADITPNNKSKLKNMFKEVGFSALNFTDSRSKFAFYNLQHLWEHIQQLLGEKVYLAHLAVEPVAAAEVYQMLYGSYFINETNARPFDYTFFKTKYTKLFGGSAGYIFDKEYVLAEIKKFVEGD